MMYLLFPAYEEMQIASRTVGRIREMIDGVSGVAIVFVTSMRESGRVTTASLLQTEIEGDSRFTVINAPAERHGKSGQLNFALEYVRNLADESAVVGVFDFDALPSHGLLGSVRAALRNADVVQPLVINSRAMRAPKGPFSRAYIGAETLLHLRRSLGIEPWRLSKPHRVCYLVGASMFLRLSALDRVGGFPAVDDIPLGYLLSTLGLKIRHVKVGVAMDVSLNPSAHQISAIQIARGVHSWVQVVRRSRSLGATRVQMVKLVRFGLSESWEISLSPWVLLASAVVGGGVFLRCLGAVVLLWPMIDAASMRRAVERLDSDSLWPGFSTLSAVAAAPFRRFWRTFGTWRYVYRIVLRRSLNSKADRYDD